MAVVRRAAADDCAEIGLLLHDFNVEYAEPAPAPELLAERLERLLAAGETAVLLVAPDADAERAAGLALLRLRPGLWSEGLEAYLAELYVVPALRGRGLGRALLEATIALARSEGADTLDLATSEDDVAARALYESCGFVNREHPPTGPITFHYELEL